MFHFVKNCPDFFRLIPLNRITPECVTFVTRGSSQFSNGSCEYRLRVMIRSIKSGRFLTPVAAP